MTVRAQPARSWRRRGGDDASRAVHELTRRIEAVNEAICDARPALRDPDTPPLTQRSRRRAQPKLAARGRGRREVARLTGTTAASIGRSEGWRRPSGIPARPAAPAVQHASAWRTC